MSALDTERSLSTVKISDLLNAVEGQRGDIEPELALNTLLHKRIADKPALLKRVLQSSNQEALRLVALRGLGMLQDTVSRQTLTEKLTTLPLVEARVAVNSIGKIGGEAELDALTSFRSNSSSLLHKRIDAARRLIAFRNGLDKMRIEAPNSSQLRQPAINEGRKIKTGNVNSTVLKSFSQRVREEVPGIELSLDRAVNAICLNQRIWLMHNRKTATATGIKNLQRNQQIPMVIMGYADCSDRPYLSAYVMSQPSENGIDMFVIRLNGEISHYGTGTINDDLVKFKLSAVKTRLAPAVRVAGSFSASDGALKFTDAATLEDTSEQAKLSRRPKLVES